MSDVFLGFGEYNGYRLTEIPEDMLGTLAIRYPLRVQDAQEYDDLRITVAVHAEVARRKEGGRQERRVPTLAELAEEIVTRGYQQASKHHHPDANGHHDAQVRLTQARNLLRDAATSLNEHNNDNQTTIIPAPQTPRVRPVAQEFHESNDDVPF